MCASSARRACSAAASSARVRVRGLLGGGRLRLGPRPGLVGRAVLDPLPGLDLGGERVGVLLTQLGEVVGVRRLLRACPRGGGLLGLLALADGGG